MFGVEVKQNSNNKRKCIYLGFCIDLISTFLFREI